MKFLIYYSEENSIKVAKLLKQWLPSVLKTESEWDITNNIGRGSLVYGDIVSKESDNIILICCLTQKGIKKTKSIFDSGVLMKGLENQKIFTFLIDTNPEKIDNSFLKYQHAYFNKESVCNLVLRLNEKINNQSGDSNLRALFEKHWSSFENKYKSLWDNNNSDGEKEGINVLKETLDVIGDIIFSEK